MPCAPDFADFILGHAEGVTRGLHPGTRASSGGKVSIDRSLSFSTPEMAYAKSPLQKSTPSPWLFLAVKLRDGILRRFGQPGPRDVTALGAFLEFIRDELAPGRCVVFELPAGLFKRGRHEGEGVRIEFQHRFKPQPFQTGHLHV